MNKNKNKNKNNNNNNNSENDSNNVLTASVNNFFRLDPKTLGHRYELPMDFFKKEYFNVEIYEHRRYWKYPNPNIAQILQKISQEKEREHQDKEDLRQEFF